MLKHQHRDRQLDLAPDSQSNHVTWVVKYDTQGERNRDTHTHRGKEAIMTRTLKFHWERIKEEEEVVIGPQTVK